MKYEKVSVVFSKQNEENLKKPLEELLTEIHYFNGLLPRDIQILKLLGFSKTKIDFRNKEEVAKVAESLRKLTIPKWYEMVEEGELDYFTFFQIPKSCRKAYVRYALRYYTITEIESLKKEQFKAILKIRGNKRKPYNNRDFQKDIREIFPEISETYEFKNFERNSEPEEYSRYIRWILKKEGISTETIFNIIQLDQNFFKNREYGDILTKLSPINFNSRISETLETYPRYIKEATQIMDKYCENELKEIEEIGFLPTRDEKNRRIFYSNYDLDIYKVIIGYYKKVGFNSGQFAALTEEQIMDHEKWVFCEEYQEFHDTFMKEAKVLWNYIKI